MFGQTRTDTQVLSSVKTTCGRLDLGKTTVFKLINEGKLDTVKIGGKTLITEASIQRLVHGAPAAPHPLGVPAHAEAA